LQLSQIRAEIEHMRRQIARQRKEILDLQRAGIPTASAEALLERILNKIDELCAERDRLKGGLPAPSKGKVLGGRHHSPGGGPEFGHAGRVVLFPCPSHHRGHR
jgi:hypothetical protein